MEEMRIQKQISIYMTNKKLCEFNDKLMNSGHCITVEQIIACLPL